MTIPGVDMVVALAIVGAIATRDALSSRRSS